MASAGLSTPLEPWAEWVSLLTSISYYFLPCPKFSLMASSPASAGSRADSVCRFLPPAVWIVLVLSIAMSWLIRPAGWDLWVESSTFISRSPWSFNVALAAPRTLFLGKASWAPWFFHLPWSFLGLAVMKVASSASSVSSSSAFELADEIDSLDGSQDFCDLSWLATLFLLSASCL